MRYLPESLGTIQAIFIVGALLVAQPALAYDHPLTDEAVRDAYFLGQDADRAADFLSKYVQTPPLPDNGPHVSRIELSTPYAQVVEVSQQHSVGYSAQDAAADYKKRGDTILVSVQIMFTPTYLSNDENYWSTVPVGLVQKTHIAARSVSGQAIYAVDHDGDSSWVIGANVYVVFGVKGVASDTLQVEVIPPGGAAVHATFDLSDLK
jgi:hypothetical protein